MGMYSHMLNQRVLASRQNGTNDYSEATFSEERQIKARVELTNKQKMSANGDLIVISAKVWIEPTEPYDSGDKIVYREVNYKVDARVDVPDGQGVTRLVQLECVEWR